MLQLWSARPRETRSIETKERAHGSYILQGLLELLRFTLGVLPTLLQTDLPFLVTRELLDNLSCCLFDFLQVS